jgi:hypothetical protein
MTELVVDEPETLLDLPKKKARSKPAKPEKRINAVDGYKEDKFCVLTGFFCKRGDCRTCHYPDGHDDSRARELEQALNNALEELKATQTKLKVFESMEAILARAGKQLIEEQQAQEVTANGQPSQ